MAAPITTTYTEEQREAIIAHVLAEVSGGRAVSRILREDDGMPASSQFWRWHFESEDLQEKVARARLNGVEAIMDETLDIADDGTNDWIEKKRDDGSTYDALNAEHVQRSKLRVDTRHKYAQMIAPRKYGAKLDLTSGGEKISLTAEIEAARRRAAENG
jgi:hypothetical protein